MSAKASRAKMVGRAWILLLYLTLPFMRTDVSALLVLQTACVSTTSLLSMSLNAAFMRALRAKLLVVIVTWMWMSARAPHARTEQLAQTLPMMHQLRQTRIAAAVWKGSRMASVTTTTSLNMQKRAVYLAHATVLSV